MIDSYRTITDTEVLTALDKARHFELCRQFDDGFAVLQPIWSDLTKSPNIEGFNEEIQAEILLRCGSLLSWHSYLKQTKDSNSTARDWLTKSHRIFMLPKNQDKLAETEMEISMTYWREGDFQNARAWIETASDSLVSPLSETGIKIYSDHILICISLENYETAQRIFNEKEHFVELCDDDRVKVHFYGNSALLMRATKKYNQSIALYEKTIKFCQSVGNLPYWGIAENNLSFLYKDLNLFKESIRHIDNAVEMFRKMGDKGRQASCFDTKAQILTKFGKLNEAIKYAEKSIRLLRDGEEYSTLVESLWTKTLILLQMNDVPGAMLNFSELIPIARDRISEAAADKYLKEYSEKFYLKKDVPFEEQVLRFERELVTEAFTQSNYQMTESAQYLGITHQRLYGMVNKGRHSILRETLPINIKKRNSSQINQIDFRNDISNALPDGLEPVIFTEIVSDRLAYLGLKAGTFAVGIEYNGESDFPVIAHEIEANKFHCGFPDVFGGILGLLADNSEPITILTKNVRVLGKIVGYCSFENEQEIYVYHPLKFEV